MVEQAYVNYIRELAEQSKSVVFLNSSPQHASIVMSTMFKHSKECIKIFAGNLRGEVSKNKEYINGLNDFLSNNGKLMILIEEYSPEKPTNITNLLINHFLKKPDNIHIKTHPFHFYQGVNKKKIHFCVADNKMYRLETDTSNFLAEGNFNDPETSLRLSSLFDTVFDDPKSTTINVLE